MRTTFRIDDALLEELRRQAHGENVSLTGLLNRLLRAGMLTQHRRSPRRRRYREETHAMGAPRVDLGKALALAAALEDDEIAREMGLRK